MSVSSPTTRRLVGIQAATARHHPEADTTQLRRDLAASHIADYVARVVAEAPPLTSEQRERIASLLMGGA